MRKAERLTPTQADLLEVIRRTYTPGEPFQARDLFPGRTAQAAAGRRTLDVLLRKGVLQDAAGLCGVPRWASGVYYFEKGPAHELERGIL